MDLRDRHKIRVTSHMVGSAVDRSPAIAKEIVERSHEAAAHGRDWIMQVNLQEAEERRFIRDNVESIKRAAGVAPKGYNGAAMRGTINTLKNLQDEGFTYHIDDVSQGEPFVIPVRIRDFSVVPCSLALNDIVQFEGYKFANSEYERQLIDEFDVLYEEATTRRRMMSISTHDRVQGRPFRVRSLDRFLSYALQHPGVVCLRKDQIAVFALHEPSIIRDVNLHDEWAGWERKNGKQVITPIA